MICDQGTLLLLLGFGVLEAQEEQIISIVRCLLFGIQIVVYMPMLDMLPHPTKPVPRLANLDTGQFRFRISLVVWDEHAGGCNGKIVGSLIANRSILK